MARVLNTDMAARLPKDGPFCWQSKAARRAIRNAFDATNNVSTALAVYDALSEIASDSQADNFTTTHAWIQQMSGVSVRTVQKHLRTFADLGLVTVVTQALRAPSTYTLHPFGNGCITLGNDCATLGNHAVAFGNRAIHAPLPTSEESQKKSEESQKNLAQPEKPGRARDVLFDALAIAEGSDPKQLTKDGARRVAVALAQIKQVCPDLGPSELQRRARIYRNVMPAGSRLTANALAINWAKCGGEAIAQPAQQAAMPKPPEGWRTVLEEAYPNNLVNAESKPWADVPEPIRLKLFASDRPEAKSA